MITRVTVIETDAKFWCWGNHKKILGILSRSGITEYPKKGWGYGGNGKWEFEVMSLSLILSCIIQRQFKRLCYD